MLKGWNKVIGTVLLALFSVGGIMAQVPLTNAVKASKPAVFKVTTYNRWMEPEAIGTGFFIDSTGIAVSNAHVFEQAYGAKILLYNGRELKVDYMIATDYDRDVVMFHVQMPDSIKSFTYLPMNKDSIQEGDQIFVIGAPQGLEGTISTGIISSFRSLEDYHEYGKVIQITAPISRGSSGSPVILMDGRVIGVATFMYSSGQNLNFAVDIRQLKNISKTDTLAYTYERVRKYDSSRVVYYPNGKGVLTRAFFQKECYKLQDEIVYGNTQAFCDCFYEKLLANYSDEEISQIISTTSIAYSVEKVMYQDGSYFAALHKCNKLLTWSNELQEKLLKQCKSSFGTINYNYYDEEEDMSDYSTDSGDQIEQDAYCDCVVGKIKSLLTIEQIIDHQSYLASYRKRNTEDMKKLYEALPSFKAAMEECARRNRKKVEAK
jgi:hypothetical protein